MIGAAIFDVDGTLVDSVDAHARSWCETLREFGHDIPYAAVRSQIGKGGDQLLKTLLPEEAVREQGEKIEAARKARFTRDYLSEVRGFPKVRELFQRLRNDGVQVALASSAAGDELQTYKEKAEIADLVSEETSRDDAAKSKPHPDIFEAAFARLHDVSRDEVLIVGDSPWDALAAGKARIRAVGVRCGGFPKSDLLDAGFAAVFQDPAELLARYEEIFGASGTPSLGRVLLVEDHADTARATGMVLGTLGYEVRVATCVESAVKNVIDRRFDIIISDVGLPDGNGISLLHGIRPFCDTPAIALTGFNADDDIARCLHAGFNLHLRKPVTSQRLGEAVASLLNGSEFLGES